MAVTAAAADASPSWPLPRATLRTAHLIKKESTFSQPTVAAAAVAAAAFLSYFPPIQHFIYISSSFFAIFLHFTSAVRTST